MKRFLMCVGVLAGLVSGAAHASTGTFTSWSTQSGQLANSDNTLHLVADSVTDSGVTWAPGSFNLASATVGTSYTVTFSYVASGAVSGGGFSVLLQSGASGNGLGSLYGSAALDDGIAFAVDTSTRKAASYQASNVSTVGSVVNAATASSIYNGINFASTTGKLVLSYTNSGWLATLSLYSTKTNSFLQVASAYFSAASFSDFSDVRLGFGASVTDSSTAAIDLVSFSATGMVPEASSMALAAAGLVVVAVARRRRTV